MTTSHISKHPLTPQNVKMTIQKAIPRNTLILFLFFLPFLAETAVSQNCQDNSCPGLKECCSRWGYCGTNDDYCGFFCFSGPCNIKGKSYGYDYNVDAGPRGKIESVITQSIFDSIIMSKVESNCTAKGFYTYRAFVTAFKSFGAYKGKVAKREIAAILSHFSYGSKGFCYKEEISTEMYCSKSKKYTCEPGKSYHGRGLLQSITWNEYYGAAGKQLGLPLLEDPDLVARDPEVAFKFAMWFWNRNVRPALYLGFGEITKRVDGRECSNWRRDGTQDKVKQYIEFCKLLGVTPDQGLDC